MVDHHKCSPMHKAGNELCIIYPLIISFNHPVYAV